MHVRQEWRQLRQKRSYWTRHNWRKCYLIRTQGRWEIHSNVTDSRNIAWMHVRLGLKWKDRKKKLRRSIVMKENFAQSRKDAGKNSNVPDSWNLVFSVFWTAFYCLDARGTKIKVNRMEKLTSHVVTKENGMRMPGKLLIRNELLEHCFFLSF